MFDRTRLLPVSLAVALLAACGGEKGGAADTAAGGAMPDTQPPAGGAAAGGGAAAMAGDTAVTPQMIAEGDSIFHGQKANGLCFSCHGPDGKGTPTGPNLTDSEWLNTDGTLQGIVGVVTSGVPQPKQYPAPMPPMGGSQLTPEQVRAVAAYAHSLSQKAG
ncbi:MAG TPA: c-type cytochrome [Gemmatimonadaceae bacterium]|jgi:mono/diheme cytochrome c family protein|nr:c-type cytochrome [Gemmatimonadaceae bacterium]